MARRTRAEIEEAQEKLEQELKEAEVLENYATLMKRWPELVELDQLRKENAEIRAENLRLRAERDKAATLYQKLTDEWNFCVAQYHIPDSTIESGKERSVQGALSRKIAIRLLEWVNELPRSGDIDA